MKQTKNNLTATLLKWLCAGGVFALLAAAWVRAEKRYDKLVRPSKGVNTIQEFLRVRPNYERIRKFPVDGRTYFEIVGRLPTDRLVIDFVLPSGPPAYVFDDRGLMVDWCGDIGENKAFERRWGNFYTDKTVSAVEAIKSIEGNSGSP
jgi:hypothetical protein